VFHRVKRQAVLSAGGIEPDNVGMLEQAQRGDFALKAQMKARLAGQLRRQDFDRRLLLRRRLLVRPVDDAHAAAADLAVDDPLIQPGADHGKQLSFGSRKTLASYSP